MNNATVVETLRPLPRVGRVRLSAQIDRLRRLCGETQEFQAFQEETLDVLRRTFGATAAAFWLCPRASTTIEPSVRSGFDAKSPLADALANLDAPVADLWRSGEPALRYLADVNAAVLVGPIRDERQPVAAIQLVLVGSEMAAGHSLADESAATMYRKALAAVLTILQPALLSHMRTRSIPLSQAGEGIELLSQQIGVIQRSIRLTIERYMQQLSGATFGSLEDNQSFVRTMQKLLDAHGLRVRCPECGHPSILRCSRNTSVPSGVFVFDHYLPQGRTFHGGGRTLPAVRITTKPARRQSS